MFTGIILGTGSVERISKNTRDGSAVQMTVNLGRYSDGLKTGQSVALNGVCLTATKLSKSNCTFEMIGETIKKTSLGKLSLGDFVNIERSLKAGDRLEGHFVQGHVDGTGTIKKIKCLPEEVRVSIKIPKKLAKHVVKKGSIAIDGISLTVTSKKGKTISVSLIPHTINTTNFKAKKLGDKVNIETDILGRYVSAANLQI
ncbi:MAG: riboflavin synthase [Thaumarchaeota archaeon]|nr:riboflavin synthase [Nitrososphaerota archaeon]